MLEGQHFQNGYITRDIEKALTQFRHPGGIDRVQSFEVPVEVTTPKGRGIAVSKLAFIWVNNLQYELIQPVSGLVDVYTEQLPADDGVKFHHICMRISDWDDFRARVTQKGYSVVLEGGSDALKFLYIDGRELVGHYLEYVWMTPERWAAIGGR
jgi:hypothetical protein